MKYSTLPRAIKGFVAAFVLFTPLSFAQVVLPQQLSFDDNEIEATIALTNAIEVDIKVEFDNAVGLNASNIDISAELLLPTDLSIVNRLPSSLVTATSGFPVVISISPKPDAGFAFEGMAMVEIYTKALHFNPALRIFRSHANGEFEDITQLTAAGSIRSRGNTGSFSDFMILMDLRIPEDVIDTKFARVEQFIADNSSQISPVIMSALNAQLTFLQDDITNADYIAALSVVDTLIDLVESCNGDFMADVWRSSDDLVNVKGELLTKLHTLRFSLRTL